MLTLLIVLLSSQFVYSVSYNTEYETIYNDFMNEIVNIKQLEKTIKDNLPNSTDDGVFIKMLDATSKIPSGILAGNFFDLGHFDECYNITHEDIYGKYCLGTLPLIGQTEKFFRQFKLNATMKQHFISINPQPRLAQLGQLYAGYHWALCIPSSMAVEEIPGLFKFYEDFCYSKATEPELSAGAIATITVLAVFAAIAVASTAFDVYLFYTNKKTPHELFIAFSFLTNGQKIFKSSNNPEQLLCLNGIRAISMMWVILGHEYSNASNASIYNFADIDNWNKDPANMLINGATVSVDTFFVVGGLVTVYTFLKSMDKGVKFNIILYYVHRYLRLTPALAIMTLIHLYLLNYMGNGPLWKTIDLTLVQSCEKSWWSTFLYITNYVQEGNCLPQGWYLSVDMQLYILSPIILIPLYKWAKPTLGVLGFLSIVGCVIPFAIAYKNNFGGLLTTQGPDSARFMLDYYSQPYTRFGPYVIGMILGYYLYKIKTLEIKIRLSKISAVLLWIFFLTGLVACVYAGFPLTKNDKWGNSLYIAFNRPAWAVALVGVLFLCISGYGHPIDSFLSLPIFQFLTKISYSMYLVHYTIISVRYASMKNTMRFSNAAMMYAFWADFMVTLGLALVLSLMFESPIIILEKYIFGRGAPKQAKSVKTQDKPEA